MLTVKLLLHLTLALRLLTVQLNPFTHAALAEEVMSEERVNECHCDITKFVVKSLSPFSKEDPHSRWVRSHSLL